MILLFLACAGGEDSAGPCDRSPPLDWENWGGAFMDRHCSACHSSLVPESWRAGAPQGVDFDGYDDVLAWRERITIRVGDRTMPPGGGPSEQELALFAEWAQCDLAQDAAAWEAR